MVKTFAAAMAAFALFCTLTVQTSFASGSSELETKSKAADTVTEPLGPGKSEPAANEKPKEKLRAGILNLVNEAKAGKVILPTKSQIQPAKSNNWSKGTKIAVGVGVAVAVVVVILVVKHEKDNFLNGLTVF